MWKWCIIFSTLPNRAKVGKIIFLKQRLSLKKQKVKEKSFATEMQIQKRYDIFHTLRIIWQGVSGEDL